MAVEEDEAPVGAWFKQVNSFAGGTSARGPQEMLGGVPRRLRAAKKIDPAASTTS